MRSSSLLRWRLANGPGTRPTSVSLPTPKKQTGQFPFSWKNKKLVVVLFSEE
jgi:hypothetical protein